MARLSVTTQKITRAGLVPTLSEPTLDGDVIDVGQVFLYVDNTTAGAVNVTVATPRTVDGLDVAELTVAVAAGTAAMIGPFPQATFAQPADSLDPGRVYVNYDVQTGVNRAAISF